MENETCGSRATEPVLLVLDPFPFARLLADFPMAAH